MSKQIEAIKRWVEIFDGNWHDELVDTDWANRAHQALAEMRQAIAEAEQLAQPHMTTNLHDKMLKAIDAYFSASDAVEAEAAEDLLLDVRDELLKQLEQPAQQSAERGEPYAWEFIGSIWHFKDEVFAYAKDPELKNEKPPLALYTAPQPPRAEGTLAQPDHIRDATQMVEIDEAFHRLIRIMGTFDLATGHADSWDELLDSLESELSDVLGHLRARREWVNATTWRGLTDEQLQMLNFLYGAGEFDGVWFDQKHPTEKGAFWWRKHLRRLFDTTPQPPAQQCWKCGDMDSAFQAKCDVPACGMKEKP